MPLVRILVPVAGPRMQWDAGDLVEMNGDEARKWADGVRGELVRNKPAEIPEGRNRRPETPEGR